MSNEKNYPEYEKRWVFILLIFVAGFYGGYTLFFRGGVFCNGQTGNLALLGMSLGSGNWRKALYYLIPISSYFMGILVSETIPQQLRWKGLRWDTLLTLIEIMLVTGMGFIPATAPHQICQVIINFICAMQYNTFRHAEGLSMATTFCVNHIRVVGISASRLLRRKYTKDDLAKGKAHGIMILSFILGAVAAGTLSCFFSVRAIWFTLLPLIVLFADLLHGDRNIEGNP
jgi:uncharacterized membrane protein YoaK (UPF0700 family)